MEYQSCFDIIGPIMVGPSSSHTAGVVSIGKFMHEWIGGCPDKASIVFFASFADTYQGHGTDKALLGGLLGMNTDDSRIRYSLDIAKEQGMEFHFEFEEHCQFYDHPNTTIVTVERGGSKVTVGGASIGGGLSKIFLIDDEQTDIRLSTDDDFAALVKQYRQKRDALAEVI